MFTINDRRVNRPSVTVQDGGDIVGAIRDWFPNAPDAVRSALDELHEQLVHREYTGDSEAYLGIRIREGQDS